jgi:hypothetical protein
MMRYESRLRHTYGGSGSRPARLQTEELEEMGMKYLSLIPIAIFSLVLQGQTGKVASGNPQEEQPMAAASVSAELTKRIDTKNAKQGDEVDARVTSTAKLPDGTELPRGTKLIGKVMDVKAKSKEDKSAHIAFSIDHAVLKDGKQMPVVVAVTSVTGSAQSPRQGPIVADTGQAQSSAGGVLKSAHDRVPVGNMPGVVLSGAGGSGSSGSLDAAGDNISLDRGTKLTLNVAAGGGSSAGQ